MRAHFATALLAFSCAAPATRDTGNQRLGIASFQIRETASLSTVVGLDARKQVVARLELVHGRFLPSEDYGPEYTGEIDGRKLSVDVRGQRLEWETLGYTDASHMPALPPEVDELAAFVTDPHVRPLLGKWHIGWERDTRSLPVDACPPVMTKTPDTTNACNVAGTNPHDCKGTPGGLLICDIRTGTTRACSGNAATQGIVTSQDQATFGWEQDTVSMCCGPIDGPHGLAVKTCAAATGINVCKPGDMTCACPAGGPPCPCPAGHYCSSCGDGGTSIFCPACYSIAGLATCSLTVSEATCSPGADVFVCRHSCPLFPGLDPPTITPTGANPVTLECASGAYGDPGATAADDCGGELTDAVTTTSTVDPATVGTYTVDYEVTDSSGVQGTASRTVEVQDTAPPAITLNGSNPTLVECHGAYGEPGATAADACDGDLTAAIVETGTVDPNAVGSTTLVYSVTDRAGHASTASRTVTVADSAAPTITLRPPIELWPPDHSLHAFTLADCVASATDACAGALDANSAGAITSASPGVAFAGSSFSLHAERPGSGDGRLAEIHFTVSDPSGNSSSATCLVSVPHDRSATP